MDDGGDAPAAAARALARRPRRQHRPAPPLARPGGRPDPDRAGTALRRVVLADAARSGRRGVRRVGVLVHTHASENRDEVAYVREKTGLNNMAYLAAVGLASPRLCAAHCVWVDAAEQAIMAERGVQVLHCPGSNLKLGSGVAPIVALRARASASRSAPMGPPATTASTCSTRCVWPRRSRPSGTAPGVADRPGRAAGWPRASGAQALGLDAELGSIAPGKRADLILVRADAPTTRRAPTRGRRSSTRPGALTSR